MEGWPRGRGRTLEVLQCLGFGVAPVPKKRPDQKPNASRTIGEAEYGERAFLPNNNDMRVRWKIAHRLFGLHELLE